MALSLEDRLLGEKTHYYCSSSDEEAEDDKTHKQDDGASAAPDADVNKYTGHCVNVSFLTACLNLLEINDRHGCTGRICGLYWHRKELLILGVVKGLLKAWGALFPQKVFV